MYFCPTSDKKTWLEREMVLSKEQLELLFTATAEQTNLKYLEVSGQPHVKEVSPELYAAALSNVEVVRLEGHYQVEDHTEKQMEALFATIALEDRPIRKLTNYMDTKANMDPDLLSRAFNRLEEVSTFMFMVMYIIQSHLITYSLSISDSNLDFKSTLFSGYI